VDYVKATHVTEIESYLPWPLGSDVWSKLFVDQCLSLDTNKLLPCKENIRRLSNRWIHLLVGMMLYSRVFPRKCSAIESTATRVTLKLSLMSRDEGESVAHAVWLFVSL
jgi:hypothetical protein